ncbi:MAG: acetoin utilization protein AcuC [Planctomycetota bacterium]
MATRRAVFIHSAEMERYRYPPEHPFSTVRARRVRETVNSMGLLAGPGRSEVAPEPAERVVLKKFHSARYLHTLKAAAEGQWSNEALSMGIGSGDCPVFADMYDYSVMAVGGTVIGAELLLSGGADAAFNPSGGLHHAGAERASGFCYMNDVAIACMVLAEAGKKVLYLDVDVHHGDGVAYAFYERNDVMTVSLHQDPRTLFPGTGFANEIGTGEGKGYCVNVPLPIGTYDETFMKAFEEVVLPIIRAFSPDVFVLQLGADGLAGDPLAHFQLSNNAYGDVISHVLSFERPVLAAGGGGYDIENTVKAGAFAWSRFAGAEEDGGLRDASIATSKHQQDAVEPAIEAVIKTVKANIFGLHGL